MRKPASRRRSGAGLSEQKTAQHGSPLLPEAATDRQIPERTAPRAHREPRLNLKPQDDVMFVRRQQCGGCGGGVWGFYILTPDGLTLLHKGTLPVVSCQVKDESGCGVRMLRLAPDCLVQIMANGGTA